MIRWPSIVIALVVSLGSSLSQAQAPVPAEAIAAETAGQWSEAARLYRVALASDPGRSDLWSRLADVEARDGRVQASIDALQRAIQAAPSAHLYTRLSQSHAVAGQAKLALDAIEAALAIDPTSVESLQARATLATWAAEYDRAQDSYQRLARLRPDDTNIALGYARVAAWRGDTDQAVKNYEKYLSAPSADASIWLELARAQSWRGNYAAAMRALETYRRHLGESPEYSREAANVLAIGGRPNKAQSILNPLLGTARVSADLDITHAIASAMQQRPRQALASLDRAKRLAPASPETRNAERLLRTLLASAAEPRLTVYTDSDDLESIRFAPQATVSFASGTQFSAGYERARLRARPGSGLDGPDGSASGDYEHTWLGASQRFGRVALGGQFGYAAAGTNDETPYRVAIEARAADALRFSIERSSGLFIVSPRTVGLSLKQVGHRALIDWSPTLQSRFIAEALYQELSDGNRRVEVTLSPRRVITRTAGFNLDLGVSAYLLQTDLDLNHGYYDPRRYEQYSVVFYPYFKISEGIGFGLTAAVGGQRDQALSSAFRPGGGVSSEATFGIYDPWVLKVNASATMNRRLESGAFQGFSGGIVLVRRF